MLWREKTAGFGGLFDFYGVVKEQNSENLIFGVGDLIIGQVYLQAGVLLLIRP